MTPQPIRVLIADDDDDVREALRDVLERDASLEVIAMAKDTQRHSRNCAVYAAVDDDGSKPLSVKVPA